MKEILLNHLPLNAIDYCIDLSAKYEFGLELSFDRKTKFGHYKYWPQTQSHVISINKGLSPSLFLITFLHELAHLEVMQSFGRSPKPHGKEWKLTFKRLMLPILNPTVFSPLLLSTLANHLKNPKASLSVDNDLWNALFPSQDDNGLYIKDIEDGEQFIFKKRIFKKIKTRRTRALCLEAKSGNNYLIPLVAQIEMID